MPRQMRPRLRFVKRADPQIRTGDTFITRTVCHVTSRDALYATVGDFQAFRSQHANIDVNACNLVRGRSFAIRLQSERTTRLNCEIPMARVYEKTLAGAEVPEVDVLDWGLIERLDQFLRRYVSPAGRLEFQADDAHGSYREPDLQGFRKQVEAQDLEPHEITISLNDYGEKHRSVLIWWSEGRRGVKLSAADQAEFDNLATRIPELFEQAHKRREKRARAEQEERKRERTGQDARERERKMQSPSPQAPSQDEVALPKQRDSIFNNPWVVTIAGGLVVAGLIAIIALFH